MAIRLNEIPDPRHGWRFDPYISIEDSTEPLNELARLQLQLFGVLYIPCSVLSILCGLRLRIPKTQLNEQSCCISGSYVRSLVAPNRGRLFYAPARAQRAEVRHLSSGALHQCPYGPNIAGSRL